MIHLNDDAIKYAISMCRSRSNYKVGIVSRPISMKYIRNVLTNNIDEGECHIRRNGGNFIQVAFVNGSYIQTIPASDNARGHRAHLLLIDNTIDRNIVDNVFRHIEILEDVDEINRYNNENANAHRGLTAEHIFFDEFIMTIPDDYLEDHTADIDEDEFMKILEATA